MGLPRGDITAGGLPIGRSASHQIELARKPALATRTYHSTGAVSFSTKGEYGVRLMAQLGRRFGSGPASLTDIAEDEDLPRAYLEQLVINLRDSGLVVSTRGARGGYELARAPESILMGEVLRALEGPIAPMICASVDPEHATECDRTGRCSVNVLWVRVRNAISDALDSMTLADLVPPLGSDLSSVAIDLLGRAALPDQAIDGVPADGPAVLASAKA